MPPRPGQLGIPTRRLALAAALGALLFAGGPAATEDAPAPAKPEAAAPAKADATEIERFCTNIADAARDRRYSMQAAELRALQGEIDARIKILEEKRAEYEGWVKRREEFIAKAEDNVVKIYARMKPDAAAERLAELRVELAAGILMKLDTRQAGTILNEMERKAAAALTSIMVSASRREDPS